MKKEIKDKIESFLSGIITTQNDRMLNQEGIDYICEKATNHILKLFEEEIKQARQEERERIREEIEKLPKFDLSKGGINGEYYYKREDILKKLKE